MKKTIFLLLAVLCHVAANAQTTDQLTATLKNGDQTTIFYGVESFKQAVDAAPESGSIITLSEGTFNVPEKITKSLSIYGVGFESSVLSEEPKVEMLPTTLQGNLMLGDETKAPESFYIEGVNVAGEIHTAKVLQSNFIMVKSACQHLRINAGLNNSIIRQSCIRSDLDGRNSVSDNLLVQNSYIWRIMDFATGSNVNVDHCLQGGGQRYYNYVLPPLFYTNSYIAGTPSDGATLHNCIIKISALSPLVMNQNCWVYKEPWHIFDEGDNAHYIEYNAQYKYMLLNPELYVGTDGTLVGLHGGDYPWNKIPSVPRITERTVGHKTTDGKLHIALKAETRPVTD